MTWQHRWALEWEAVTTELRKYDLSGIRLAAAVQRREDLRELLEERYNNLDEGIDELCKAVGLKRILFTRRCRGDMDFLDDEKEAIIKFLNMTEEEIERYL